MTNLRIAGIRVRGKWAYVPLPDGRRVLINTKDIPRVAFKSWRVSLNREGREAVVRDDYWGGRDRVVYMVNDIMRGAGDVRIGSRNGNPLDLRRINLIVTKRRRFRWHDIVIKSAPAPAFRALCNNHGGSHRLFVRAYGVLHDCGSFPSRELAFEAFCDCVKKHGPNCV